MDWQGKVAVVTGGAQGIGQTVCEAFAARGAQVASIDRSPHAGFQGDLADEHVLEAFAAQVIQTHGHIDYLIHNAMLTHGGLDRCGYTDFMEVLRVGVAAPYYLTRLLLPAFHPGGAIVNLSSTRYLMSQPNTESYTAAKGGVTALTHALAVSLAGRVRVNAVAPGWIDTTNSELTEADIRQHPAGRVGTPEDIVQAILFLCGEESRFITGQVLTVDGGMTKQMIYTGDEGWEYHPD